MTGKTKTPPMDAADQAIEDSMGAENTILEHLDWDQGGDVPLPGWLMKLFRIFKRKPKPESKEK